MINNVYIDNDTMNEKTQTNKTHQIFNAFENTFENTFENPFENTLNNFGTLFK